MSIDRRQLLLGTGAAITIRMIGPGGLALEAAPTPADRWHPLTKSLLERARMMGWRRDVPDRALIERTISQFADASGWTEPLVIKWMNTPTDAFDHINLFGLDALLSMGSASFWRRARPSASPDEEACDRAFEVRMLANELLCVEEHDRALMAPKLLAKFQAMSTNLSDREVYRVRAISSQISWLETSIADVAAQSVSNVEALLSMGEPERSVAVDHQSMVFETYEHGLIAMWETPDALICV